MGDIHDYIFFFFASLFLVVLKVAGFVDWAWWVTALPAAFAVCLHIITVIASR
jgi:hypothetical protein